VVALITEFPTVLFCYDLKKKLVVVIVSCFVIFSFSYSFYIL